MSNAITVNDLAYRVGGRVFGDGETQVESVASLDSAGLSQISYVDNERFFDSAKQSGAACLIVPIGAAFDSPCRIEVKNPKLAFALIAEVLHPPKQRVPEIHSSAVFAADAKIGRDVFIGGVVFGGGGWTVGGRAQARRGARKRGRGTGRG